MHISTVFRIDGEMGTFLQYFGNIAVAYCWGEIFSLLFSVFSLTRLGVFFFFWHRYFVNYTPLLCVVCKFRYSLLPRPYFIAGFYEAISV